MIAIVPSSPAAYPVCLWLQALPWDLAGAAGRLASPCWQASILLARPYPDLTLVGRCLPWPHAT